MSLNKDEKNNDNGQQGDEHKEPSPEILRINKDLIDYLYQGDMALTVEQAETLLQQDSAKIKRQALNGKNLPRFKWGSTVPYTFDENMDSSTKSLILKALKFWESQTCLRFEENANVKSKLKFFKGDGCWSYVGKIYAWDSQQVSIGEGCEHFGVITHEIAHALGFFHAQSRYDRDSFVSFKAQNVESGFEDQFDKEMPDSNDNYGVTYDYGSVMHYSDSAFAKYEKRPVLVASEPHNQNTMGQRMQPSFSDVLVMNRHYNCLDQCKNSETKCANGGYPTPKDCSKCTCPWGFGGPLCNERQDASNGSTTCGQTLQATSEWQQLDGSVGDSTKVLKTDFTSCHWHIGASEGKKIELQVLYVGRVCSSGCFYGNVEFKTNADFGRTGHRMCCAADAKDKPLLKTDTNLAVISAYTRFFDQQFVVKYRAASLVWINHYGTIFVIIFCKTVWSYELCL
ncbi:astacin (Peptidase family m12A) domain-containing protein [Ditylenchus destructor]|uniref:Zinc metalloproteinase n=1 Tax=Ditylenchus destructor TaxID=166010 RepID=A0AAD4NL05_9BILA|nr:astacin (Peptidase family m12A) domain-containing protein [Ditylenchus destructor]